MMPGRAPIIQVCQLRKSYDVGEERIHALKSVEVKIYEGEFVSIMGPSGSGKSTFMNMIGFLDNPSSGEVYFEGRRIIGFSKNQLATLRNTKIGFVFQQFFLLPRTSALDNVMLPLFYSNLDKTMWIKRAQDCLAQVGLLDRQDHHPSQLSGGQQQRVAIARALVNNPSVIMADEPTGAIDTETGLSLMQLLQELNANGTTLILVTHETDIAAFAGRRLTFRDGNLIHDGYSEPSNASVELQKYRAMPAAVNSLS